MSWDSFNVKFFSEARVCSGTLNCVKKTGVSVLYGNWLLGDSNMSKYKPGICSKILYKKNLTLEIIE
jgi:hypothetical protein